MFSGRAIYVIGSLHLGVPTSISVKKQNRPLSAGMPLVEGVGGPILPEDCQDQHRKRKFAALLLPRIAASLVLPQVRTCGCVRAGRCRKKRLFSGWVRLSQKWRDTVREPISTPHSRGFYRGCFKAWVPSNRR